MSTAFYQQAKFYLSSPDLSGSPPDIGYEVAFIGRSNVGKSSAINTITAQNKLAKVSKIPGRTQHLVYFNLGNNRRLVDLPGYGYAQVPLKQKIKWQKNINRYLKRRQSLKGLILLIDIRHLLKALDIQMLKWCAVVQIPVHIMLTKADKVSNAKEIQQKKILEKNLANYHQLSIQTFSAAKKQNLKQVCQYLDKMLEVNTNSNAKLK